MATEHGLPFFQWSSSHVCGSYLYRAFHWGTKIKVQKRLINFDERESWCQFHQHFTLGFFIQKFCAKLFLYLILGLNFFLVQEYWRKCAQKMLVKLTIGIELLSHTYDVTKIWWFFFQEISILKLFFSFAQTCFWSLNWILLHAVIKETNAMITKMEYGLKIRVSQYFYPT